MFGFFNTYNNIMFLVEIYQIFPDKFISCGKIQVQVRYLHVKNFPSVIFLTGIFLLSDFFRGNTSPLQIFFVEKFAQIKNYWSKKLPSRVFLCVIFSPLFPGLNCPNLPTVIFYSKSLQNFLRYPAKKSTTPRHLAFFDFFYFKHIKKFT